MSRLWKADYALRVVCREAAAASSRLAALSDRQQLKWQQGVLLCIKAMFPGWSQSLRFADTVQEDQVSKQAEGIMQGSKLRHTERLG